MTRKTTNPELVAVIRLLKKQSNATGAAVWDSLAKHLASPKHRRVALNLSRINRYTQEGATVAVPGKVLGSGVIDHEVTVAAMAFSTVARKKIEQAGGRCIPLRRLMQTHPAGSGVRIIG
jgi:large subunit ribosomal protein L18e